MIVKNFLRVLFCFVLFAAPFFVHAQYPVNGNDLLRGTDTSGIGYDSQGRPIRKQTGNDSLKHRDPNEDSITIFYRFFDSTRVHRLDSSLNDFDTRFVTPYYYTDLGNTGTAAHPLLFSPYMKPGFDAGFHAYDLYRYTVEGSKFFQTTRPYTELGYLLGSKSEQIINVITTQNRKSNFNITFEYRLVNVPGTFQNQHSAHNNIRLNTLYQSTNKRYGNYFVFISNKLRASENGGLQDEGGIKTITLDVYGLDTRLGTNSQPVRNPFSTDIKTGNIYTESILFFRQYYDLGQKDSLVTDTATYKLFYPRIRFQHTIKSEKSTYNFVDGLPVDSLYLKYYNYVSGNYVNFQDQWSTITNDVAVISFPDKKNVNQFLKLNAGYEMISGGYYPYKQHYNNLYAAGEYRNRTKNQKWDVEATGQFYVTGSFSGDYAAYISLRRELNKKLGSLEIGAQNVNRSPAYIFKTAPGNFEQTASSFPVFTNGDFKKENIFRFFSQVDVPTVNFILKGEYFIVNNYMYFDNFYYAKQETTLFNVLHINGEKKFKLNKHWNLYSELHLQQAAGNPPVHIPLILTRQRIAFEGNFYKNLFISTGFEVVYNSPFKPDNYMPLNGQFFFQDAQTISNRPEVNFFLHFRIRSFKGFLRAENINTIDPSNSFKFTANNFSAPHYPMQPLWIHVGVWWSFVN